MICWGNLSLSKIIGGVGGTPHRRILLFCKIVYLKSGKNSTTYFLSTQYDTP